MSLTWRALKEQKHLPICMALISLFIFLSFFKRLTDEFETNVHESFDSGYTFCVGKRDMLYNRLSQDQMTFLNSTGVMQMHISNAS